MSFPYKYFQCCHYASFLSPMKIFKPTKQKESSNLSFLFVYIYIYYYYERVTPAVSIQRYYIAGESGEEKRQEITDK